MSRDQIDMANRAESKLSGQRERADKLAKYRKQQRFKALERDDFKCMVCRYLGLPSRDADETHHVYGRGTWNTRDIYEHHRVLLSICNEHHRDYHFIKKTTSKELMEKCLKYANSRDRRF